MTLDHGALLDSLDALDTSVIARGGTNIGRAIDVAASTLATEPARQKVMVLLTDGEDLEGQGLDEAKRAGAAGIIIDTVGVGTGAGELVPARDAKGAIVGVVRGEDGAPVRSHLDEAGLRAIAAATHGTYRPLGQDGRGLDRLYDESLAGLLHVDASSRTRRVYDEWFEIPLGLALFGLVLDALLGWRWPSSTKRPRGAGAAAVALAVAAARLHGAPAARAPRWRPPRRPMRRGGSRTPRRSTKPSARGSRRTLGWRSMRATPPTGPGSTRPPTPPSSTRWRRPIPRFRSGCSTTRAIPATDWAQLSRPPRAIRQSSSGRRRSPSTTARSRSIRLTPTRASTGTSCKRKLAELEQQAQKPKNDEDKKNGGKDKDKDDKGGPGKDQDKGAAGDKSGPGKDQGKSAKGGPGKDQDKGASGDKGDKRGPPPTAPGHDSGLKQAAGERGDTGEARGEQGSEGAKAAQPGQLSAPDARALLRSLRGEERHGVSHGSGTRKPSDDAPSKDW